METLSIVIDLGIIIADILLISMIARRWKK